MPQWVWITLGSIIGLALLSNTALFPHTGMRSPFPSVHHSTSFAIAYQEGGELRTAEGQALGDVAVSLRGEELSFRAQFEKLPEARRFVLQKGKACETAATEADSPVMNIPLDARVADGSVYELSGSTFVPGSSLRLTDLLVSIADSDSKTLACTAL